MADVASLTILASGGEEVLYITSPIVKISRINTTSTTQSTSDPLALVLLNPEPRNS